MAAKMVAMILAGGKGTRLEALTKKIAKPAVSFGGKYRIIDFPLSNCANSKVNIVGVLTQYESVVLDEYIGNGEKWGLNGVRSLTTTLAPRQTEEGLSWYKGTADAIYANLDFLESVDPDYVLILSGDHIYAENYDDMLSSHIQKGADCTISVYEVPWEEASRFGILVANEDGQIVEFQEKPAHPTSNLASMGIYIFNYKTLVKYLKDDAKNENSSHDFGKNIIPNLLNDGKKLNAYKFAGYWKDVGTIASLHEANMDLLNSSKYGGFDKIFDKSIIYSEEPATLPSYVGKNAEIIDSLVNIGTSIDGYVKHSVISNNVIIEKNAKVINSVVLSGAHIKKGALVENAIVSSDEVVEEKQVVKAKDGEVILYAKKGAK